MKNQADHYKKMIKLATDAIGYCLYGNVESLEYTLHVYGTGLAIQQMSDDVATRPQASRSRILKAIQDALKKQPATEITTIQLGALKEATERLAGPQFISEEQAEELLVGLADSGFAITPALYLQPKRLVNERGGLDAADDAT